MINNRQQSGRRRGRGGQQRPQGGQGRSDQGSRIDNRARGNAAQLLEKYKTLARDAQLQGDRVMTEYYLQFADHYFRVVSEARARFEENQPRRPRDETQDFDDDSGEDFRSDESGESDEGQSSQGHEEPRGDRNRNRYQERDRNQDRGQDRNQDRGQDRPERTQERSAERGQDRNFDRGQDRGQDRERQPRREPREQIRDRQDSFVAEPRAEASPAPRAEAPVEASEPRAERRPRTRRAVAAPAEANGNVAEPVEDSSIADRLPPSFAVPVDADEAAPPRPKVRRPRKTAVAEAPAEG